MGNASFFLGKIFLVQTFSGSSFHTPHNIACHLFFLDNSKTTKIPQRWFWFYYELVYQENLSRYCRQCLHLFPRKEILVALWVLGRYNKTNYGFKKGSLMVSIWKMRHTTEPNFHGGVEVQKIFLCGFCTNYVLSC